MSAVAKRFVLRNELAALPAVVEEIESLLAPLHLPARDAYAISLVLDECLSNTINYGYPDGAPHEIQLELQVDAEQIRITIEDDGVPFDPLATQAPDLAQPMEDRPIGGLGIHLTRKVMDHCTYERVAGRNRLAMTKQKSLVSGQGELHT